MSVSQSSSLPEPNETSAAPEAPASRHAPLAARKQLLGWQGFTLTLPTDWNLAQYGGNTDKGTLRIDDGDGPRIELRWETLERADDKLVERSVSKFLQTIERKHKKEKLPFQAANHPHIVSKSRKQKAQLVNFGWTGDDSEPLVAHGWGTAWHCSTCNRVVFAHLMGRGKEKSRVAQGFATEVFNSMECHGHGGWQAWSIFGLSVEIPTEFIFTHAKLQTGRIELEWERPLPKGLSGWQARAERIALRRISAANVLLENESLEQWTIRTQLTLDKRTVYRPPVETTEHGDQGLLCEGLPRKLQQRAVQGARAKLLRQNVPQAELRVWHAESVNKILVLETELTAANAHVLNDVLDSLEYQ